MASRSGRAGQGPPPSSNRQNEYFVPRDGIDREVITADICRYLGNDALVRPGVYESPQTGQVVQGYYITAYRNLTTAMIEDLKADSARWDQERRRNTVGVQYRNSDTHQSRQYYGPTETSGGGPAFQDNSRDSYDGSMRYPGTGNAGYTGASGGYPNQPYGAQGGYGGQPGYANAPAPQFPQAPADPYQGNAPMAGQGFGQPPSERPYAQAVNLTVRPGSDTPIYGAGDPYTSGSGDRSISSSSAPGRPTYVTSGAPTQPGYAPTSGGSGFYPPANPGPSSSSQYAVHPNDVFLGRGNNPSSHEHQYETTPPPRTSASASNAQMATSGSSSRRDNRDSVDRTHGDSRQRHHRR